MADSRRPVNDELEPVEMPPVNELEREERRLERLRLIVSAWPTPKPPVPMEEFEPDPRDAA